MVAHRPSTSPHQTKEKRHNESLKISCQGRLDSLDRMISAFVRRVVLLYLREVILLPARVDFYSLDAQRSNGAKEAQAIAYSRGAAEHSIISYLPDRFLLTMRAVPSEL